MICFRVHTYSGYCVACVFVYVCLDRAHTCVYSAESSRAARLCSSLDNARIHAALSKTDVTCLHLSRFVQHCCPIFMDADHALSGCYVM